MIKKYFRGSYRVTSKEDMDRIRPEKSPQEGYI